MAARRSRRIPVSRGLSGQRDMYAEVGDLLMICSSYEVLPERKAEVLEVAHTDGSPPYRVRWFDTGREALVFPGSDAVVVHPRADAERPGSGTPQVDAETSSTTHDERLS